MTYFGPILDPFWEVQEGPEEQYARIECPEGILKGILGPSQQPEAMAIMVPQGPSPEGSRNGPFQGSRGVRTPQILWIWGLRYLIWTCSGPHLRVLKGP